MAFGEIHFVRIISAGSTWFCDALNLYSMINNKSRNRFERLIDGNEAFVMPWENSLDKGNYVFFVKYII